MPTCVRASAEMIPWVTVWPTPNGLPIASTTSPTCNSSELAKSSVGNFSCESLSRSTARSLRGSFSTIWASNSRLSDSDTLTSSAPFDDMHIGHDQAGGVHHHTGTQRTLHLFRLLARHPEEAAEDRIIQQRIAVLHHLGGIDVDHRRLNPLHDRGIGEPQFRRRGRHAPVLDRCDIAVVAATRTNRTVKMRTSDHEKFPGELPCEYRLPEARIEVKAAPCGRLAGQSARRERRQPPFRCEPCNFRR